MNVKALKAQMRQGIPLTKAEAGYLGGKATVKIHGVRYMRRLGKWGAHRLHAIYDLEPVALNDFALVHKETRIIKAYLSGKPVEGESAS